MKVYRQIGGTSRAATARQQGSPYRLEGRERLTRTGVSRFPVGSNRLGKPLSLRVCNTYP
jgi:hypothetical protein